MSSRIIGGRYVDPGEYPSTVSFQRSAGLATCGGTIINSLLILTACHCIVIYNERNKNLKTKKWSRARLVAGSTSRYYPYDSSAQVRFIFKWTRHPQCYRDPSGDWEYDFATVIPTQKFIFNEYVGPGQPIGDGHLPNAHNLTDEYIKSKRVCVVLGWGAQGYDSFRTEKGENASQYLKLTEVQLQSDSTCATYYCYESGGCARRVDYVKNKGQLCAKVVTEAESPCVGDSGGPMFCEDRLFGIVSYGTACGQYGHPLVYGRVDMALDFIFDFTITSSTASSIIQSWAISIIQLSSVRLYCL